MYKFPLSTLHQIFVPKMHTDVVTFHIGMSCQANYLTYVGHVNFLCGKGASC